MRCKKAQRQLEAYLDGELTGRKRAGLEGHLTSCAECTRALEHARRLRRVMDRGATPPLPEGFQARLMDRARQRAANRGWSDKILRPFGWEPAMSTGMRAAVAAAVIVALGVGILIGRNMWREKHPQRAQSTELAQADPVEAYGLDSLAAPSGNSLTGAYVSLVSDRGGE